MKTILFFLLCGMTFCLPFKNKPALTEHKSAHAALETLADTVSFTNQIQPMLQSRCTPCHFPGGKMYEKMPFDKAKTIVAHPDGILKRFKDEKESQLFKQFLAQQGK